jgi:hypothetical protein
METKISPRLYGSYQISLEKATWLVYAFLRQTELGRMAINEAIGGTITKKVFEPERLIYKGSMGWYCRNSEANDYPPFFLALEDSEYDPEEVLDVPKSADLIYPMETFKYTRPIRESEVMSMLTTDKRPLHNPVENTIPRSHVMGMLNKMPNDPVSWPYNNYYCSFFENRVNNEVQLFLKSHPDLRAVRYYFGYDDSEDVYFYSNRIRLILIGVNGSGENLPPPSSVPMHMNSSSLLQNSWPPPPPIE